MLIVNNIYDNKLCLHAIDSLLLHRGLSSVFFFTDRAKKLKKRCVCEMVYLLTCLPVSACALMQPLIVHNLLRKCQQEHDSVCLHNTLPYIKRTITPPVGKKRSPSGTFQQNRSIINNTQ